MARQRISPASSASLARAASAAGSVLRRRERSQQTARATSARSNSMPSSTHSHAGGRRSSSSAPSLCGSCCGSGVGEGAGLFCAAKGSGGVGEGVMLPSLGVGEGVEGVRSSAWAWAASGAPAAGSARRPAPRAGGSPAPRLALLLVRAAPRGSALRVLRGGGGVERQPADAVKVHFHPGVGVLAGEHHALAGRGVQGIALHIARGQPAARQSTAMALAKVAAIALAGIEQKIGNKVALGGRVVHLQRVAAVRRQPVADGAALAKSPAAPEVICAASRIRPVPRPRAGQGRWRRPARSLRPPRPRVPASARQAPPRRPAQAR